MCKNQSMVRELGDGFYNTDKNSDIAKINLRKNIEYVKKLSENRKKKYVDTEFVNGKKPESCPITVSLKYYKTYFNSLCQTKIIFKKKT